MRFWYLRREMETLPVRFYTNASLSKLMRYCRKAEFLNRLLCLFFAKISSKTEICANILGRKFEKGSRWLWFFRKEEQMKRMTIQLD